MKKLFLVTAIIMVGVGLYVFASGSLPKLDGQVGQDRKSVSAGVAKKKYGDSLESGNIRVKEGDSFWLKIRVPNEMLKDDIAGLRASVSLSPEESGTNKQNIVCNIINADGEVIGTDSVTLLSHKDFWIRWGQRGETGASVFPISTTSKEATIAGIAQHIPDDQREEILTNNGMIKDYNPSHVGTLELQRETEELIDETGIYLFDQGKEVPADKVGDDRIVTAGFHISYHQKIGLEMKVDQMDNELGVTVRYTNLDKEKHRDVKISAVATVKLMEVAPGSAYIKTSLHPEDAPIDICDGEIFNTSIGDFKPGDEAVITYRLRLQEDFERAAKGLDYGVIIVSCLVGEDEKTVVYNFDITEDGFITNVREAQPH